MSTEIQYRGFKPRLSSVMLPATPWDAQCVAILPHESSVPSALNVALLLLWSWYYMPALFFLRVIDHVSATTWARRFVSLHGLHTDCLVECMKLSFRVLWYFRDLDTMQFTAICVRN